MPLDVNGPNDSLTTVPQRKYGEWVEARYLLNLFMNARVPVRVQYRLMPLFANGLDLAVIRIAFVMAVCPLHQILHFRGAGRIVPRAFSVYCEFPVVRRQVIHATKQSALILEILQSENEHLDDTLFRILFTIPCLDLSDPSNFFLLRLKVFPFYCTTQWPRCMRRQQGKCRFHIIRVCIAVNCLDRQNSKALVSAADDRR
ncbi:MAG: hypothetical protein O3C40_29005 [Planctomycetota bacterium]|nr:hypothetical protein [Planctomycetota bacterium]